MTRTTAIGRVIFAREGGNGAYCCNREGGVVWGGWCCHVFLLVVVLWLTLSPSRYITALQRANDLPAAVSPSHNRITGHSFIKRL